MSSWLRINGRSRVAEVEAEPRAASPEPEERAAGPVFRFAPSPNGALHLGHAFSALLNADRARATGGRLLLRIEDIDTARCTPDLERAMLEDLRWLGFAFERPVRRQSEHFDTYATVLERLREEELIYPAFATRGEVRDHALAFEARTGRPWPRDPDGAPFYPPGDRERSAVARRRRIEGGEAFAWRLDMGAALARLRSAPTFLDAASGEPVGTAPALWGDVVLARRDTPTSYHLAVVVDDALQGVGEVVRGRDLLQATAVHRVLQELLGLRAPRYRHHDLILDRDGRKLSKSRGSAALSVLREGGATAADIRRLVGLPPDPARP